MANVQAVTYVATPGVHLTPQMLRPGTIYLDNYGILYILLPIAAYDSPEMGCIRVNRHGEGVLIDPKDANFPLYPAQPGTSIEFQQEIQPVRSNDLCTPEEGA